MSRPADEIAALRAELDALKTRVATHDERCPGLIQMRLDAEFADILKRNAARDAELEAAKPKEPEAPPREWVKVSVTDRGWETPPMVSTRTVNVYDTRMLTSRQVSSGFEIARGGFANMLATDLENRLKVDPEFKKFVEGGILTVESLPEEKCRELDASARRGADARNLAAKMSGLL